MSSRVKKSIEHSTGGRESGPDNSGEISDDTILPKTPAGNAEELPQEFLEFRPPPLLVSPNFDPLNIKISN